MTSLILLEDEPVLSEELADFLTSAGHCVTTVMTLAAFRDEFQPELHQIAVIDLGLPDGDGLDLIGELRDAGYPIGIVALTARGSIVDKVAGLARGADHYLFKTVDLSELAATIDALARRIVIQQRPRWILQTAPRQLLPPGYPAIPLSGQDYTVLLALAEGKGGYVTREVIVRALGEDFFHYDQRRLDTQMRRLRRKIEEHCGLKLPVTTLRSVGFHFYDQIEIQH